MPAYHPLNEAQTRYGLIGPQLSKQSWNECERRSVSLKVPVDGYDASLVNGITDVLKYVLKLEEVTHFVKGVQNSFAFMLECCCNAGQTHSLHTAQAVVIQKRQIEVGNLYKPPVTNFGLKAAEKLFSEKEMGEILV